MPSMLRMHDRIFWGVFQRAGKPAVAGAKRTGGEGRFFGPRHFLRHALEHFTFEKV